MTKDNRIEWIDICKGIGIILVVIGHTGIGQISPAIYDYIYSFHMPLFYFLSGLTFKNDKYNSLATFLKRRFWTLILPFLILNLIVYIYISLSKVHYIPSQSFSNLITGCLALYFLRVLLITEVWHFIIWKINKKTPIRILFTFLLVIIIDQLRGLNHEELGLTSNDSISYLLPSMPIIYYTIGNSCKFLLKSFYQKFRYSILSLLLSIGLSILILNYGVSGYFRIIPATLGITSCIIISIIISQLSLSQMKSFFLFVGKNTIIIVAFHQIIYNSLQLVTDIMTLDKLVDIPLRFAMMVILLYGLIKFINNYFPILAGKYQPISRN